MRGLCPFSAYSTIFGLPGKGAHRFRFLNTAIIDYLLTLFLACVTTYLTLIPLVLSTIGWFILSIIIHMLFGVDTNTLRYLGVVCGI